MSLLASQGMPSAAVELGHVYIEGLGTKQDIPRAERYFKFAEKAGYEAPEFWLWKHYGVTMRQVVIPENRNSQKRETCMYLVREKIYVYEDDHLLYRATNNRHGNLMNVPVWYIASTVMKYAIENNSRLDMNFCTYDDRGYPRYRVFEHESDKQ